MYHFTPPTVLRPYEGQQGDRLFCRMKLPVGVTVLKSQSGGYSTVENPSPAEIDAALVTYLGGCTYEVSAAEADALTAAGYEVTE
jgi:hypothetical protein